jgi:hypothetical protein
VPPKVGAGGIRQTAKAPVNLRICGGFAIYVDGSVDGFGNYEETDPTITIES